MKYFISAGMKRALWSLAGIIILSIPATSYAYVGGDVNDDGTVNVGNAVRSISHIFKGGSGLYSVQKMKNQR